MISGCEVQNAPHKLTMEEFAELYTQTVVFHSLNDSLTAAAQVDSLLGAKKISREDLKMQIAFYEQDLDRWADFYKLVVANLEMENKRRREVADSIAAISLKSKK